jgi:hypothetical protein
MATWSPLWESSGLLDVDGINPGVDFMQVIAEIVTRSWVLLVISGPQWLDPQLQRLHIGAFTGPAASAARPPGQVMRPAGCYGTHG